LRHNQGCAALSAAVRADAKGDVVLRTTLGWIAALVAAVGLQASPARAWGDLGHRVVAAIAYHRLTPRAKTRVDQLLAQDHDDLTANDFASAATWADRDAFVERETARWHFAAFPLASTGPFDACPREISPRQAVMRGGGGPGAGGGCIVAKLPDFADQLASPSADPRALKFLIHLVADLHAPLHLAADADNSGGCVKLANPAGVADSNLHNYWDTEVVRGLGGSAEDIAGRIERTITPAQADLWVRDARGAPARGPSGWPALWARETVDVAARQVYTPLAIRGCDKLTLTPAYLANSQAIASQQLAKSAVRLAFLLNQAFDR
jgi:hypothetical protein